MELQELQTLLAAEEGSQVDFQKVIDQVIAPAIQGDSQILTYQKQYDSKCHDVTDEAVRPDKIVKVDDANGNAESTTVIKTARLPIPIQKKIVSLAAAFLCGHPIELDCTPDGTDEENLLTVIKRTWEDNKLDYYSKKLAKLMMAETKVAEVWYAEKVDPNYWDGTPNQGAKVRMRMKILSYKDGDKLYPVFNANGDMIAFGREYCITRADKQIDQYFDLYTEKVTYKAVKLQKATGWDVKTEPNPFGKIPIIYYSQEVPEWFEVQEMIDRMEKLISNHADTNDYNGSPLLIIKGKILSFAKKGESGKIIEIENDGSADYLEWNQLPESVKLEHDQLSRWIYSMTGTPDISFETMKSIGVLSGFAIKLLFLDAHLKASDKEETFGIGIQRRINLIKAGMAKVNTKLETPATTLSIKPKFEYYLPKDDKEMMDILTEAVGGGKQILSTKTAVELNPLVKKPEVELQQIKDDQDQAQQIINNNPGFGLGQ